MSLEGRLVGGTQSVALDVRPRGKVGVELGNVLESRHLGWWQEMNVIL